MLVMTLAFGQWAIMKGRENDKNEYNEGEILMGYSNFDTDFRTKESKVINSGDYVVTEVSKEYMKNMTFGPNLEKVSLKGYDITIKDLGDPNKYPVTIFMLSRTNDSEIFNTLGRLHEEIRLKAIDDANVYPKGRAWAPFYDFQKSFATPIDISFKGKIKIKKTLDYGYAHTIHKSQGGTYKYIAVDSRDIYKAGDTQLEKQLKYVALSRATTHAYVLTTNQLS